MPTRLLLVLLLLWFAGVVDSDDSNAKREKEREEEERGKLDAIANDFVGRHTDNWAVLVCTSRFW